MRDRVAAYLVERARGVAHRFADDRGAACQPAQQGGKAEGSAERRAGKNATVPVVSVGLLHDVAVVQQRALVVQHELGQRGRAGCRVAEYAGVAVRRGRRGGLLKHRRIVVHRNSACGDGSRGAIVSRLVDGDDAPQVAKRLGRHVDQDAAKRDALEIGPHEEPIRTAASDDRGELLAAKPGIDRKDDCAEMRAGQEGFDPGQAVRQPDGDAIARRNAQARKCRGETIHARMQRGKGDGRVSVDQRGVLCMRAGKHGHSFGEGHGA